VRPQPTRTCTEHAPRTTPAGRCRTRRPICTLSRERRGDRASRRRAPTHSASSLLGVGETGCVVCRACRAVEMSARPTPRSPGSTRRSSTASRTIIEGYGFRSVVVGWRRG
jgi:hypothetical protein